MPCNPLREAHVKQMCANLRGGTTEQGKHLVANWLKEERITRAELLAGLGAWQQHHLLGAPQPPYANGMGYWAMQVTTAGRAAYAEWQDAVTSWQRDYLAPE